MKKISGFYFHLTWIFSKYKKHKHITSKCKIVIVILFFHLSIFSQIKVDFKDYKLPSTKGYRNNPVKLVLKLTDKKETEKEKFDAIFLWVASNISYNYSSYLSPSGASVQKVNRILKKKQEFALITLI